MLIELTASELRKMESALIDNAIESKKYMENAAKYNQHESYEVFENDRYKCIKLANKINDYMIKNKQGGYSRLYDQVYLSGVELKNYLSWLEKQEA